MSVIGSPEYLVGIYETYTVAGYTKALDGTFTIVSGTSSNLGTAGTMGTMQFRRTRALAQIQPVNAGLDNFQGLSSGFSLTMNELRAANGLSALDHIAATCNFVGCTVLVQPPGAVSPTYTATIFGIIEDSDIDVAVDQHYATLSARPCGVATYTGAPT